MYRHPKIKEPILYVFPYGSKVYGTNTAESDDDLIVIVKQEGDFEYAIDNEKENIRVYSESSFQKLLDRHDIVAMECYFSNETNFTFELDLVQLRNSISAVVHNSLSKAMKKMTVQERLEPYLAKKSLFHSLRILDFGIQIAEHGRIVDFTRSNHHLHDIMNINTDEWEPYREKYEPIANQLKKQFKVLAPIPKDIHNKKW